MTNRDRIQSSTIGVLLVIVLLLPARAGYADATAPCNTGSGLDSTECGVNSSATGNNSAALGVDANATGGSSIALGRTATASGTGSTALGASVTATAVFSTALGADADATGTSSTAVGVGTNATASDSTAVGALAFATAGSSTAVGRDAIARSGQALSLGRGAGFNSGVPVTDSPGAIAIGSYANIQATSPGGIAIGADTADVDFIGAEAAGAQAIAIGEEAKATAAGAIALGANVVADKANTMTVGVPVEVRRDDGTTQVLVNEKSAGNNVRTLFNVICDTCTPGFRFNQLLPSNQTWNFRMLQSGAFSVDDPATIPKEAEFRSGGDLRIGGTLIQASSREIKTGIRELEAEEVLSRLERLPVSEWSYKKDHGRVKHIGPMAEDFHALFNVGVDNRSISSLDTSGVALAAVKSLHQENKQLKADTDQALAKIADLQHQIDELKEMLASMVALNQSKSMAGNLSN